MNKPPPSELANLAEIIGAIALVISLVYVEQELRSNTAAVGLDSAGTAAVEP